jgi:hypothetical protein
MSTILICVCVLAAALLSSTIVLLILYIYSKNNLLGKYEKLPEQMDNPPLMLDMIVDDTTKYNTYQDEEKLNLDILPYNIKNIFIETQPYQKSLNSSKRVKT